MHTEAYIISRHYKYNPFSSSNSHCYIIASLSHHARSTLMDSPVHRRTMEFELAPSISVLTGTFSAVIAPEELVLPALTNPDNGRYLFLYLAGNTSGLLPALAKRHGNIEVRRVASPGQLAVEIRASRHSILFVGHDPSLYACEEDTASVAHALKGASEGAVVVLYAQGADPWFDLILSRADQVYFFREPPVPPQNTPHRIHPSRKLPGAGKGQATLLAFFGGVL